MGTSLPYSESTEAALIARILVDPHAIAGLHLDPADFYVPQYRQAYKAMQSLVAKGRPVDLETLKDEGCDLGDVLERITPAHRADPSAYADIVRRDAFRRRYINELTDLIAQAESSDNVSALVSALQDETLLLAEGIEPTDVLGRVNLLDYQHEPDPPLLGVLSPVGTTVLYGAGGDGKGWVAARLMAQLVAEGRRVAVVDFEMQATEWGWRLKKFGVNPDDVLYFAPSATLDLWATHRVAQLLKAEGVQMLCVDSAMYASNVEDPYSPNGALAYGRARRRLNNLPALLLAHVTGNQDRIFGSVFWRNESRVVWRLNKDEQTRSRYMVCRKANSYGYLEHKRLNIVFDEPTGTLEMVE